MKLKDIALAGLGMTIALPLYAASKPAANLGLGAKAPKNAVVLFEGKGLDAWTNSWAIPKDGSMQSGNGDNISKQTFEDGWYHVEFKVPLMPDKTGQARGNSGIFLQERYEVQVLDSFGIEVPGKGDCGALYNVSAPLVNACKEPKQWQAYDIIFKAPRFDADGKKTENARLTVFQNGILIQNNAECPFPTFSAEAEETPGKASLKLQDHGNTVCYRNIWVLPLPLKGSDRY